VSSSGDGVTRLLCKEISDASPRGIASTLTRLIRRGDLPPGTRLPTIRELAGRIGASPTTVNAAWRLLREARAIETNRRGGTIVVGAPQPPRPQRFEGLLPFDRGDFALDLSRIVPDPALLPDLDDALAWARSQPDVNTYAPATIIDPLRTHAAAAWPFTAESFLVVNGGYDALALLARGLLTSADAVAVEEPTSPRLLDIIDAIGAEAVPVGCDSDGPDPAALMAALRVQPTAFIYQTRAQSPTGHSVPPDRITDLAKVLADTDVAVIENDSQPGIARSPAVSIGSLMPERTAHVRSYSKSHGPDLRIAIIGGAARLVHRAGLLRSFDAGWTSRLLQGTLAYLLADPVAIDRVEHAGRTYASRRELLTAALAARNIHTASRDGMGVWLPVLSETASVAVLASKGVAVQPGGRGFLSPQTGGFIRVSASRLVDGYDEIAEWIAAAHNCTWT
jgi:DNA-binding transcriptional MocR family regulator